jgi:hypothetical protein
LKTIRDVCEVATPRQPHLIVDSRLKRRWMHLFMAGRACTSMQRLKTMQKELWKPKATVICCDSGQG